MRSYRAPSSTQRVIVSTHVLTRVLSRRVASRRNAEERLRRLFFHTPRGDARGVVRASLPPLTFTTCMWVRTTDFNGGLLSYSAPNAGVDFALLLVDGALVVRVHDHFKTASSDVRDGLWHFLCVSWSAAPAQVSITVDAQSWVRALCALQLCCVSC
jgi:hypothetical protein